jgi:hypothetical protein
MVYNLINIIIVKNLVIVRCGFFKMFKMKYLIMFLQAINSNLKHKHQFIYSMLLQK